MEQLAEYGREYHEMQERLKAKWKAEGTFASDESGTQVELQDAQDGDRLRVQIQFNAFPLVGGEGR
jgi:hypothetical protein